MFSVEARDLSKCAFPDAVSTITICHFLISKINAFFRLSSLHSIADFCITNGAKKALKIPPSKCRYLQLCRVSGAKTMLFLLFSSSKSLVINGPCVSTNKAGNTKNLIFGRGQPSHLLGIKSGSERLCGAA